MNDFFESVAACLLGRLDDIASRADVLTAFILAAAALTAPPFFSRLWLRITAIVGSWRFVAGNLLQ